ncbi:ZINC FINGER PROTEIN [Salix purpurea]|uniref:ZINC FINGER PROTEIN n=1 Tax=Salix purpurea TaxID=77065 RepID=A0A9Q0VUJ7_SALPP|nr:ZINC FINGER PROTEIN [Salix purpurea]
MHHQLHYQKSCDCGRKGRHNNDNPVSEQDILEGSRCISQVFPDVAVRQLRNFFEIQEAIVCNKCVLKHSCNFVNQSVWRGDNKTLNLAAVMRVLTLYALEAAHPELSVPDEIKASVNRLLTEILSLSQTVRQAA